MATLSIDDTRSYNYQWLIENPKQFFLETIQNQVDLESYTAGEYLYRITIENTGLIENYILIDEGFINVVLKDIDIFKMLPKEYDPAMYGTSNTLIYSLPKLNVPKSFVNALGKDIPEEYVNQFVTKAEELTGCTGDINLGIGCLKLKLTDVNNQATTKISDNSFQPSLYSVVMKDFPKFDFASSLRPDPSKEYTYEGTLIKDYGAAIGEEIFFMKWDEARPTVTVKDVETITDAKEITVKPGIINLKLEKPEDLQNKVMTISLKGNYFTGENKRFIKIVKYESENTLQNDKTGGNGTQILSKTETTDVTEDKYKSLTTIKTIIDFTDESKYEPDKYYGIFIYLTDTATKPVARGMFKVYNMPFVMRVHHQDHLGTDRMITDLSGNVEHYNETLAYGELVTDPLMNGEGKVLSTTGYTGHEHDFDTGFINMQARLMNPRDPKFNVPDMGYDYDVMDPMSQNLYSYVRGNPINATDPTGKDLKMIYREPDKDFGHIIIQVVDHESGNVLESWSFGPKSALKSLSMQPVESHQTDDIPKYLKGKKYKESTLKTDKDQDKNAVSKIKERKEKNEKYDLNENNCATTATEIAEAVTGTEISNEIFPSKVFKDFQNTANKSSTQTTKNNSNNNSQNTTPTTSTSTPSKSIKAPRLDVDDSGSAIRHKYQ